MKGSLFVVVFIGLILLSSFMFTFPVKAQSTLDNGLVLYLPFNEGTGLSTHDLALDNNGTLDNSDGWGTGVFSNCLNFSKTNIVTTIPTNSAYNFGTEDFSVSFWVYCRDSSNADIINHWSNTIGWAFCRVGSDRIAFYSGESVAGYYDGIYSNNWILILMTRHLDSYSFYVNGAFTHSVTGLLNDGDTSALQIFIGNYALYGKLNGSVDDVRVYNRALTAQEVADLYAFNPSATPTPTPTASVSVSPSPVVVGSLDIGVALEMVVLFFMVGLCFVGMRFFSRVPVFLYLIGLFTIVIGVYFGATGWSSGLVVGFFGLFVLVVGAFTVLVPALGLRVRR